MKDLPFPRTLALLSLLLALPLILTSCTELQDLRQIKEYQDRRITDLERLLEKKTLEQDAMIKQQRETERQSQDMSGTVNQLTRELNDTKQALDNANRQIQALGGQLQTKDASLSQTAATLQEQSQQARTLEEQVTKTQTDLGKANEILKEKDAEIRKLKEDLGAVSKRAEEIEQSRKQMETELVEAKSGAGEKDETLASLQKENEDLKGKLKSAGSSGGGEGASSADYEEAYSMLQQSLKPVIDAQMASVAKDNRGVVVRLSSDYLFQQDTMDLDPQVQPTLDQIATVLNRYPNGYVEVQGHTDNQAIRNMPFSDNWALAAARAQKVVRYLAEHTSLKSSRMKSSSASQYRPLGEGGGKMNRRVEIVLTNQP